jgi:hypothetical protein
MKIRILKNITLAAFLTDALCATISSGYIWFF